MKYTSPPFIFKLLLLCLFCIGQMAEAQDPPQYGTPFDGVPDPQNAVIYQINMRSFSSSRDFQGVISRLDYIKDLGVNVIYLLPTYPIGSLKSVNSPYCVKDYMGVNTEFGSLSDLRTLVDEAHNRGMSVIFDWVANHSSWDHAWISDHPDWYEQDEDGNIVSPSMGWADVAQLNFASPDMRVAMIEAMKYWVYIANCDGFRCDYADGPPENFWKQAIDTLRNITSHKLLLLAEGGRNDHFSSGFDYMFGFAFFDKMKNIYGSNASVTGFDQVISDEYEGADDSQRVVHYTTNHDVNSEGTPLDWFEGFSGSMAAFVATAYMKGVPFIYNGQEVGYPDPIAFMNTSTLIDWSLNPTLVEEYKSIVAFYRSSSALRNGALISHHSPDVCAFEKVHENDTVFVLANLRNKSLSYSLPSGISNKRMYDAFTNEATDLESEFSLSAFEYRVFADSGAVIALTGITLSKESDSIEAGSSKQLFASISPPDATYKNVDWNTSDSTMAVVNTMGMVRGISPGTVFVIGSSADQSDTCLLTITGIPVTGINIIPESNTLVLGNALKTGYSIQPEDASNKKLRWRSGNTAIASVDDSGTVKALAEGFTFIYAETEDGGKKDSCEITVTPGTEFTVYFSKPANWASTIKIYYWDPSPAGILEEVFWPGVDMSLSEGWYQYTFTAVNFTNLIFNDRSKQTGNLVRDKDGWYKDDIWYDTNPDPVAITEERPNGFSIYPNPVEDGHITVLLNSAETAARMRIIDLQGRMVYEIRLIDAQTTLDISFLTQSLYMVSVRGDSFSHHQSIFVNY